MNVSPIIKYRTLAIAKALSPVDTGNLRHNAISIKQIKSNTWTIYYDKTQASYLAPLEEGWQSKNGKVHTRNKGFIKETSRAIASYLTAELTGRPTSRWYGNSLSNALSTSQGNIERDLRNLNSRIKFYGEVTER